MKWLGALDYDPSYTPVFYDAFQPFGYKIGMREPDLKKIWYSLTPQQFTAIIDKYNVQYIVTERDYSSIRGWVKVYGNNRYIILHK